MKQTKRLHAIFLLISMYLTLLGTLSVSAADVPLEGGAVITSATVGGAVTASLYDESPPLSPAMNVIRSNFTMRKVGLIGSDITFKPEEFEKTLGVKKINYITITELPADDTGVLTLGGKEVSAGQTISRENIQYIRLIPYPDRIGSVSFRFKDADDTTAGSSVPCSISVLGSLNFAPLATSVSVETQKNIIVYKSLSGSDPDGDKLYYSIVSAPEKGVLTVNDANSGSISYRPSASFTGSDKFSYRVYDEYGNSSNVAEVKIKVTKAVSEIKFADMENHWAANSAVKAYAAGIIDAYVSASADGSGGDPLFEPNKIVTREVFTAMLIKAAKLKLDSNDGTVKTTFADDKKISDDCRAYVVKAEKLGIVKGISTDTGVYFEPQSEITRAEAATMINNVLHLAASREYDKKYNDQVLIPDYAASDIAALSEAGIIKGDDAGNVNPHGSLIKAQAVELLACMQSYAESSKGGFWKWLTGIFGG
ncbi:hypothetical protein FACS1894219_00890 [Clostridia bacterium]|nr:hypothetical protein FACS1894219_00890 [Clostridia bacterium]